MLKQLQKKYTTAFLKPYLTWYLKKERVTKLNGFILTIKPGVFHPKYFFSTGYLFEFISKLNLKNKCFLEIGSGSGIISLLAYQKKAIVTCCDINEQAVACTRQNFTRNFNSNFDNFSVYKGDLFDAIPKTHFDIIVINPPYFFKSIEHNHQLAWNCGENGEYFKKLFTQLHHFIHQKTEVYMILAENCEIERIQKIATNHNFKMTLHEQKKIKWEVNYMFKITSK